MEYERPPLPECLRIWSEDVERLRARFLFDDSITDALAPEAEQHFLLALAALEQAQRHLMLSNYAQLKRR